MKTTVTEPLHIGRLKNVPLRELWRHEARDFTTWLAANLDLLGEVLGFSLTLLKTEASTGTFSADILADGGSRGLVVIENQLESTDHDHLGKLITYLSNLDANIAVWITSAPRPEHERAIHWLNEWLPNNVAFYLVKVQAFRIESHAAPLFSVVAGPSKAAHEAGDTKKEIAERHVLRREFWTQLLARAKNVSSLHARISPGMENWVSASAGRSGISFNYLIRFHDAQVELYLDTGDTNENKRLFDLLFSHKDAVEQAFSAPLDWQRLDGRSSSRISYVLNSGGLLDKERWPEIQDQMIAAMLRLEAAFRPQIQALPRA
jgi:hypothetical protein